MPLPAALVSFGLKSLAGSALGAGLGALTAPEGKRKERALQGALIGATAAPFVSKAGPAMFKEQGVGIAMNTGLGAMYGDPAAGLVSGLGGALGETAFRNAPFIPKAIRQDPRTGFLVGFGADIGSGALYNMAVPPTGFDISGSPDINYKPDFRMPSALDFG